MKKGISLVALVITIIVLIILVGAVVITGLNAPKTAQLAVFYNNVGAIQEAVTTKMMNNTVEYTSIGDREYYKWVGVVNGYTEEQASNKIAPEFNDKTIKGISVEKLDSSIKASLNIADSEFEKYYVDSKGIVYHEGFNYDGNTYYNKVDSTVMQGGGEESGEGGDASIPIGWNTASLNNNTPYIAEEIEGTTYYAPIPKGFTVSQATTENTISGGLVIYEGTDAVTDENVATSKTTRNQFVWVPVNNSYTMGATEDALAYWETRVAGVGTAGSGFNEPYPRTEGNANKIEWDKMHASVMKYGGFYIGRYEAGKITDSEFVVKQGQTVWNNISWNSAVPLSRAKYTDTTKYGVTSTLIYGIQWDAMMYWANCASAAGRHGLGATGAVENDKYNNVYDLRSNVMEYSMEAYNDNLRVRRGGNYDYYGDFAVSKRLNDIDSTSTQRCGSRLQTIALCQYISTMS